jgi:hypothetical protein
MAGISFSVFKDKIISGAKRQTIRAVRKNPIKEGETLYLWWKQRSLEREKLGEAKCLKTTKIQISKDKALKLINAFDYIWQNIPIESPDELRKFAIADGFDNWQQMVEFFETTHGLPFEGVLIQWDEIK